jgi:hypothetical protein
MLVQGVDSPTHALPPVAGFRLDRAGCYPFGLSPVGYSPGAIPGVVRGSRALLSFGGAASLFVLRLGLCFTCVRTARQIPWGWPVRFQPFCARASIRRLASAIVTVSASVKPCFSISRTCL